MTKKSDEIDTKFIDRALSNIDKKYGKGSVFILDSNERLQNVEVIPTGSYSLNKALGVGGLPKGRIVEIMGEPGVGKSSLALQVVAEAQKLNLICVYIDVENAMDVKYAKSIGVQTDKLLFSQPNFAEEAIDIAEELIQTNQIGVVVIDSVAALIPKSELEGEIEDNTVALQARFMSKALRRLSSIVSKSGTVCIFVNQLRDLIGVTWGKKSDSPGGKALKFYSSVRIEVIRIGSVKIGDNIIGNKIKAKVVKNKVAAPFKEAEFNLIFGKGIDSLTEIINAAISKGVIAQSGAWFSFNEERLGQGKEAVKDFLNNNPILINEIIEKTNSIDGEITNIIEEGGEVDEGKFEFKS